MKLGSEEQHDTIVVEKGKHHCLALSPTDIIKRIVMAGDQEEAFFLFDQNALEQNVKTWTSLLPNVTPIFDVGCNNSDIVVQALHQLGVHFNVQNKTELDLVVKCGVTAESVSFGSLVKVASHLRLADNFGVHMMAFDTMEELEKIGKNAPNAKLMRRVNFDPNEDDKMCLSELSDQFSVAASLGLPVVAVQLKMNPDSEASHYVKALVLIKLITRLALSHGHHIKNVDLGLLHPCGRDVEKLQKIAAYIQMCSDAKMNVFAHANHYFVESAFTFAAKVIGKRVERNSKNVSYVINEGVFGAFGRLLHDDDFNLRPEPLFPSSDEDSRKATCDIYGPTGHDIDQVCVGHVMQDVDIGDWLLFDDMGSFAMSRWEGNYTLSADKTSRSPSSLGAYLASDNFWFYGRAQEVNVEETIDDSSDEMASLYQLPEIDFEDTFLTLLH